MGIQDKTIYSGVPSGFDAVVLSEIAQEKGLVLYVASSDTYLFHLKRQLSVVAPKIPVLVYPEWDTVPYDRADVADDIVSCQADTLSKLPTLLSMVPSIVLTTVRALIQKTPPVSFFKGKSFTVTQGQEVSFSSLQQFLQQNGYVKTSVVHAAGEYALRGGILDVFVVGYPQPVRIDFFGDLIDSLRLFDSQTQRTIKEIDSLSVKSVSLYDFTADTRRLFNVQYRHFFPQATDSVFLEAIRSGVPTVGLSQFMPLFHSTVDSFFDYIQPAVTVLPADFHIAKEGVFVLLHPLKP